MVPTGKAAGAGFLATSGPASASGTPAMIDGGKVSVIPVLGGGIGISKVEPLGPAAEALATQDVQGLESSESPGSLFVSSGTTSCCHHEIKQLVDWNQSCTETL